MIRTLVVENEKPNIDYITGILNNIPDIEILTVCLTVLEATEKINIQKPELVFLDIGLDVEDGGIKVLQHTRSVNYDVIFTTSHANYAADAFKFSALHYLLRPFGIEDVQEAIERFRQKKFKGSKENIDVLLHNIYQVNPTNHKIAIPVIEGYVFIKLADIIFCKADNNCTNFYLTTRQKLLATKTLKWVEELLNDHDFYRVHDSYIVNIHHILKYTKGGEGGVVVLSDEHEVDVSRRRKDNFLKMLADKKMIHSR